MSVYRELPFDRVGFWRRQRCRKCVHTWARIILPDQHMRTGVFRFLSRWAWFRRFMSSRFGMVFFHRVVTPKFSIETVELKTYQMDLRQILCDNAVIEGYNQQSIQAAIDSGAVVE